MASEFLIFCQCDGLLITLQIVQCCPQVSPYFFLYAGLLINNNTGHLLTLKMSTKFCFSPVWPEKICCQQPIYRIEQFSYILHISRNNNVVRIPCGIAIGSLS